MPEISPGSPSPQFNIIYIMRRYQRAERGGIHGAEKVSKDRVHCGKQENITSGEDERLTKKWREGILKEQVNPISDHNEKEKEFIP